MFDRFIRWHVDKYKCRPIDGVARYAGTMLEGNVYVIVVGGHGSSKRRAHKLLTEFLEDTVSGDPTEDAKNLVKAGYSTPNGARILVMSYPRLAYDDAVDLMIAARENSERLQNAPQVL